MRWLKPLILISAGGFSYILIELAYRGRSHWSMFLVGGLAFYLIGLINELIPWDMPMQYQAVIGSVIVTFIEFVSGVIINLYLGWNVWDYSGEPFNLLGQICLPFSLLWVPLAAIAIFVDDYSRYKIFGEEVPHYCITGGHEENGRNV